MKLFGLVFLLCCLNLVTLAQCEDEFWYGSVETHITGRTRTINVLYKNLGWDIMTADSSTVRDIRELAHFHLNHPTYVIEIQSHTDTRGSEKANLLISQKRAESIVNYLIQVHGANPECFIPKGYGEQRPVISDSLLTQAECERAKNALHSINRRTVIVLVSN